MNLIEIAPDVYSAALGMVNVFYIRDGKHLALIDAGNPGDEQHILEGARQLGSQPRDITTILLTHCHTDHAGGLAALVRATGARVYMHAADAQVVRGTIPFRPFQPAPGLLNRLLVRLFIGAIPSGITPTPVDYEFEDDELLPIAGGIRAYHTPGHSHGHLAFRLERDGGILFAGDACSNLPFLSYSIVYEDFAAGQHSLARLAQLRFNTVCFGHGKALSGSHARRFNARWQQCA